jgi:hypothetical protein
MRPGPVRPGRHGGRFSGAPAAEANFRDGGGRSRSVLDVERDPVEGRAGLATGPVPPTKVVHQPSHVVQVLGGAKGKLGPRVHYASAQYSPFVLARRAWRSGTCGERREAAAGRSGSQASWSHRSRV